MVREASTSDGGTLHVGGGGGHAFLCDEVSGDGYFHEGWRQPVLWDVSWAAFTTAVT